MDSRVIHHFGYFVIFEDFRGIYVILDVLGCFCPFEGFDGILLSSKVLGTFWREWGYFDHFERERISNLNWYVKNLNDRFKNLVFFYLV